tara:strand:+ start:301 stop:699 length:399 start_codon:yes stop_codon:yes gene_type:complete
VKNKFICFSVNTLKQAEETIQEANKNNIKPIIFIKYYIVKGFGVDWIKTLQLLLASSFTQSSFELYVDANTDYGLSIELISIKIRYIKLRCNHNIIKKINQIAKKNRVILNPSFRIVDLSNIKNISRKISTI